MKRPVLSAAILARDEEHHIGECLESVAPIADEVVVILDDRSRDRTAEVCRAYGATLHRLAFQSYPAQRNHALERCQGEWVLFIDADERITPELYKELLCLKHSAHNDDGIDGYAIPRHNLFFGHTVRGGGWYPDYQLRLLRRARARYDERQFVHEVALLDGASGTLTGHLLHINIEHMGEFWHKQASYALAEARILHQEGRRARARNFMGAPAREFWRRYVRLGGWRDGLYGLFLCLSLAWFEVVKYGCLLLIQRSTTP